MIEVGGGEGGQKARPPYQIGLNLSTPKLACLKLLEKSYKQPVPTLDFLFLFFYEQHIYGYMNGMSSQK